MSDGLAARTVGPGARERDEDRGGDPAGREMGGRGRFRWVFEIGCLDNPVGSCADFVVWSENGSKMGFGIPSSSARVQAMVLSSDMLSSMVNSDNAGCQGDALWAGLLPVELHQRRHCEKPLLTAVQGFLHPIQWWSYMGLCSGRLGETTSKTTFKTTQLRVTHRACDFWFFSAACLGAAKAVCVCSPMIDKYRHIHV